MRLGYDTLIGTDGQEIRFVRGADDDRHHDTCPCDDCVFLPVGCTCEGGGAPCDASDCPIHGDCAPDAIGTHFACAACGAKSGEDCRKGCDCAQCDPASHG